MYLLCMQAYFGQFIWNEQVGILDLELLTHELNFSQSSYIVAFHKPRRGGSMGDQSCPDYKYE